MRDYRFVLLILIALVFLGAMAGLGRLPNIDTDEAFYKAAGRELGMHGRFAAPELTGYLGVRPPPEEVWLLYPPLYPLLFGGVVSVFGFGWRQCVLFDAVIKVALALLTYSLVRRLLPRETGRWPAFWAGLATLLFARSVAGRPDELATALGMAGLLPLVAVSAGMRLSLMTVSGALFGLCAGTSLAASIVLGLVALVLFIATSGGSSHRVSAGMVWLAAAAAVFAVLVVPIVWNYPGAQRQYLQHAKAIFGNDTRTLWGQIADLFRIGWRVTVPVFGFLAMGLTTAATAAGRGGLRRWATIWLGPLAGAAFILFVDPHMYYYVWFLGPYALAAILVSLSDPLLAPRPRSIGRAASIAVLALLIAVGAIETVRQTVILAAVPQEQRPEFSADRLRRVIPAGSVVLTYDAWWFLADRCRVYTPQISQPYWNSIDYVVLTRFDTLPPSLEAYVRKHFSQVYDYRNPSPRTLFGLRLSRTIRGFGMLVLARSDRPHPGSPLDGS